MVVYPIGLKQYPTPRTMRIIFRGFLNKMQAQFIPSQSLNPLVFRVILGGRFFVPSVQTLKLFASFVAF